MIKPDDLEAMDDLASCYYYMQQYEEAYTIYEKLSNLNPSQYRYFYILGLLCLHLKRDKLALKNFKKVLLIDNTYDLAYFYLGVVYGDMGNFEQAIENFEKAIELNPKKAESFYLLGISYAEIKKLEEARKNLIQAKLLDSSISSKVDTVLNDLK
jgi:tetratricopeptide (TPR) repeat protein